MGAHRNDVVHREVAEHAGLDLNLLGVGLPFYLVAGLQLLLRHDVLALEHLYCLLVEVTLKDLRTRGLAVETAFLGLLNPFV